MLDETWLQNVELTVFGCCAIQFTNQKFILYVYSNRISLLKRLLKQYLNIIFEIYTFISNNFY